MWLRDLELFLQTHCGCVSKSGAMQSYPYSSTHPHVRPQKYKLQECIEQYGLITDKVWYESFEGLDTLTENYIRNMRANGEMINKNPRIIMSTIHGAKGGEADKVLLLQDLTNAALETFSHDPDELHRLFYTGATRAKKELHIVDPKNFDRAYLL